MRILGISCWYHDAAAALVVDGEIVAAAQEERFTRRKHDAEFPENAVRYCLAEGGADSVDAVAFYDKPLLKFHRILENYLAVAPKGLGSFVQAVPTWLKEKLWAPPRIEEALDAAGVTRNGDIHFTQHHESHAASAFYPSPFEAAAVLTLDGVGEWATTTVGVGDGHRLELLREIRYPHSLGLLYSAFTYFTGFRVNSGEYKLMGLAPYGEPRYADAIRRELIDLKEDGSFRLNLDYFGYLDSLRMTNERFERLFGGPPRQPETPIGQRERDLARSIQVVTEEAVLKLARYARQASGKRNLCLAGGVALNCVANGVLLREGIFDDLWIQPAAGDAGGALGAALAVWHQTLDRPRRVTPGRDAMRGSYLGPEFPDADIRAFLDANGYVYQELAAEEWAPELARLIAEENVIGLCHGRMEFGPRALGNRSIVGDARSAKMQSVMNLKIKFRESFRPFAPCVLREDVHEYFEMRPNEDSPYMLLVADVRKDKRLASNGDDLWGIDKLKQSRSVVPAITHVDYSARVQTVDAERFPRLYKTMKRFKDKTGCPVIINTSFNVRGEPIVCSPDHAYRCFMGTNMDLLVIDNFVLYKSEQPGKDTLDNEEYLKQFQLD